MAKTMIVSEKTIRDLLEAHASLSAWYYEMSKALRAANAVANTPDDAARAAFVPRLAQDFPELAEVTKQIDVPRVFVPPPPPMTGTLPSTSKEEPATVMEPAQARQQERDSRPEVSEQELPAPPEMVDPKSVRYDDDT